VIAVARGRAEVAVADTGVGISEAGVAKLCTEIFSEKTAQTREATGTGLGLSIVTGIVDFYHGRVDVRSKLGEGSTFALWLSLKTASRPPNDDGTGGPPVVSPE
jgi:signal transduction histidine kinase